MKEYDTRSCGYKLKFQGPETVEEYDQRAGKQDSCLEDAVSNTIYRGTLPEWQEEFAKILEQRTGLRRGIDEGATAKVKERSKSNESVRDVPERFRSYNNRVRSEYGKNGKPIAELDSWAQEVANKIVIDPAPSARVSAAAKGDLQKADDILDHDADYVTAKVNKMLGLVPDFQLEVDEEGKPERQSLARLIGKWIEAALIAD